MRDVGPNLGKDEDEVTADQSRHDRRGGGNRIATRGGLVGSDDTPSPDMEMSRVLIDLVRAIDPLRPRRCDVEI